MIRGRAKTLYKNWGYKKAPYYRGFFIHYAFFKAELLIGSYIRLKQLHFKNQR
jgi:hypothetical protein